MKKSAVCLLLLLGALSVSFGQDPIYSQYYAAPLQINPGFVGSAFAPRIGVHYRNQWSGFNNAYRTYSVSYEQSLERLNSGIGFSLETDNAGNGIYKTSRFSAIYAYKLMINKDLSLKFGTEAGFHQTSLNWDKLIFPDDIDGRDGITVGSNTEIRPDEIAKTQLDLSAGLLMSNQKFWLGVSLKHLNTPNDGFLLIKDNLTQGLPIRYTFHAGTELIVNKGNKLQPPSFISPNFLFVSQGPYQQINLGAYAGIGSVFGGLWYRHTFANSDAAIILMGFKEGIFKVGLSYDITVSGLSSRSGGTYELTIGIMLDKDEVLQKRNRAAKLNDCLGMFR
jgi:type IX secretion system PorP/SprF family membrane protein